MEITNIKKAVIFGTGKYGAFWYDKLKDSLSIIGFIDNDTKKQKGHFRGLPVYSVTAYNKIKADDTTVLLSFFHEKVAKTIIEQLENECALKNRIGVSSD